MDAPCTVDRATTRHQLGAGAPWAHPRSIYRFCVHNGDLRWHRRRISMMAAMCPRSSF